LTTGQLRAKSRSRKGQGYARGLPTEAPGAYASTE
jgi:hypothetical protein